MEGEGFFGGGGGGRGVPVAAGGGEAGRWRGSQRAPAGPWLPGLTSCCCPGPRHRRPAAPAGLLYTSAPRGEVTGTAEFVDAQNGLQAVVRFGRVEEAGAARCALLQRPDALCGALYRHLRSSPPGGGVARESSVGSVGSSGSWPAPAGDKVRRAAPRCWRPAAETLRQRSPGAALSICMCSLARAGSFPPPTTHHHHHHHHACGPAPLPACLPAGQARQPVEQGEERAEPGPAVQQVVARGGGGGAPHHAGALHRQLAVAPGLGGGEVGGLGRVAEDSIRGWEGALGWREAGERCGRVSRLPPRLPPPSISSKAATLPAAAAARHCHARPQVVDAAGGGGGAVGGGSVAAAQRLPVPRGPGAAGGGGGAWGAARQGAAGAAPAGGRPAEEGGGGGGGGSLLGLALSCRGRAWRPVFLGGGARGGGAGPTACVPARLAAPAALVPPACRLHCPGRLPAAFLVTVLGYSLVLIYRSALEPYHATTHL